MATIVEAAPVAVGTNVLDRPLFPALQEWIARVASWELGAYLTLTAIAFTMRIWDVGARAMHHDESLHATYAWYLFKGMGYQYNPVMHGPLQFFVTAFFFTLFGDSETTARLFAVLCGTAIVFLPWLLRREIGRTGALTAAVALAISPTFLYYSRFVRDDIYLCFFALVMAIALWRILSPIDGLKHHTKRWVYILAAAAACAMASMEAAYILFFIFGTFVLLSVLVERFTPGRQPVSASLGVISFDSWLIGLAVFLVITILLYSSFFTNPAGVIDVNHSLLSPNRVDILGGLTYWLSQHGVARGGQPWFYYFLLLPLYEQFALLFGGIGIVWAFVRRETFITFLAYWFVASLALYSWAGEKMPWLLLHPLLPGILLGSALVGKLLTSLSAPWRAGLIVGLVLIAIAEIHSAVSLSYADGANPTEMLIYVQTSNDVPQVAHEVLALAPNVKLAAGEPFVQVDDTDLDGWPFEWYFRNLPGSSVSYSADFSHPTAPVLLMLGPEATTYSSDLSKNYVESTYVWNWWFPEDYKGLTFDNGMCGTAADEAACAAGETGTVFLRTGTSCAATATVAGSNCSLIQSVPAINVFSAMSNMSTWRNLWDWFVFRTPFGHRGTRQLCVFIRKDLVPKGSGSATTPAGPPISGGSLKWRLVKTISNPLLQTPQGVSSDGNGRLLVADGGTHRILVFGPKGNLVRNFGEVGTGPGQFNEYESPMDAVVGRNGHIYAVDFWNHRIEEFTSSGVFLHAWGAYGTKGPKAFYGPRSVVMAPNGDVVVADTGNRRIAVFGPSGRFLFQFGTSGNGPGQFEEPSAVTVGLRGRIYVADYWNSRIQYFSGSGHYLGSWPVSNWTSGSYQEPFLTALPNGRILATLPTSGLIEEFSPSGRMIGTIAPPGITSPTGITVISNDRVAVSDGSGSAVDILAPPNLRKR